LFVLVSFLLATCTKLNTQLSSPR